MKKKVFFLINSLENGGAERVIMELTKELTARKFDARIITLKGDYWPSEGAKVRPLSRIRKTSSMYLHFFGLVKKVERLVEKEKPDVMVSLLEISNLVNIFAARKTKHKCIISVRAAMSKVYTQNLFDAIMRHLVKWYYPKADIVVVNANESGLDLAKNFSVEKKRLVTIYNPVNIERIKKLANEPLDKGQETIFRDSRVIITVGRMNRQKCHAGLLKSFRILKSRVKDAKLVIIGYGALRKKLEAHAKALGLAGSVFFVNTGRNNHKLVARADVFAFTTLFEGFPNVLLEAMSVGTPVVSTDCSSGPRELLAPGTNILKKAKSAEFEKYGVLCPVMDESKIWTLESSNEEHIFASALEKILKSKALRAKYSKAAEERARDFSVDRIANRFIKFISEVE